jgi:hypothetical protein
MYVHTYILVYIQILAIAKQKYHMQMGLKYVNSFISYNIFPSIMQLIISPLSSHNMFRPYRAIIRCLLLRYNCCTVWYVQLFISHVNAIPLNLK